MPNQIFKTCMINGQERYALAPIGGDIPMTEISAQMFPEALLSFVDLDMSRISALISSLDRCMASLTNLTNQNQDEIFHVLETLAQQHIYFELFRLDWGDRIREAQSADALKRQWRRCKVCKLLKSLEDTQHQVEDIFAYVLDHDRGNGTVPEKAASYYKLMGGTAFSFRPQFIHYELWGDAAFTEVLYPGSIYDLVSYHLQECVKRELRLRVCRNCGRYFHLSGRSTAMYCCRPYDEKGHICRKNAPVRAWAKRNEKDEVFREYRREYKRRFAWINAGKIERNTFFAWSRQAKEKKEECSSGSLSFKDFVEWLRES